MNDPALRPELAEEDRARAECYALVSRLFYAPPDDELLLRIAAGPDEDPGDSPDTSVYTRAFAELRRASRSAEAATLRQEYDDLFVGAGKALIPPYTSGYAAPQAPDRHLVALREQLASWGLARRGLVFEVEDHVSALCDVMRWLIERGRPLSEQRSFFDDFVYAGVAAFCSAIERNSPSAFYRAVGALTEAFVTIERDAFAYHTGE